MELKIENSKEQHAYENNITKKIRVEKKVKI